MTIAQALVFDRAAAEFAEAQTNCTLRSGRDVEAAIAMLRRAVLPVHPDRPKNWDGLLALHHACALARPEEAVLDAGAELYSAFLPSLRDLGYEHLTGINLTIEADREAEGILYRHGDITAAPFADQRFGFIACLSVIEHGVDVAAFLREQSRLLRPGGHLFVSFDYWREGVDTRGQSAYGAPIRVFTEDDVAALLAGAQEVGLAPTGRFRPECDEPVVHWRDSTCITASRTCCCAVFDASSRVLNFQKVPGLLPRKNILF